MVGVCRAHRPVLHDGCALGRLRPMRSALEGPVAKFVHHHSSADRTSVDLALLGMHAAVYSRVRFVRLGRPPAADAGGDGVPAAFLKEP